MDTQQCILIAGILLFCSVLQGTVGFAFSLFAVPALLFTGLALPEAVMLALLAGSVQRLLTVSKLRGSVDWRHLFPLIAVGLLAVPLGILLLHRLADTDKSTMRLVLGMLILLALALQWASRIKPRPHVHWAWGVLAAICSGVLSGLANIGGPPIVLWVHAHDWPNEKIRVTTLAFSLPMVPFQFAMLLLSYGPSILPPLAPSLLWLPTVLAGTALGIVIGRLLPVNRLRLVAYVLLLILCGATIMEAIFK